MTGTRRVNRMKNNDIVEVRDLERVSPQYVLKNLKGGLNIRFEDGVVIKMKMKDIVLSRYYWTILYKYPVNIDSSFRVSKFYKNKMYGSDTHLNFLYSITRKLILDFVKRENNKRKI